MLDRHHDRVRADELMALRTGRRDERSHQDVIVANTNTPPTSASAPAISLPRKDTKQNTKNPVNDRPVAAIKSSTTLFK